GIETFEWDVADGLELCRHRQINRRDDIRAGHREAFLALHAEANDYHLHAYLTCFSTASRRLRTSSGETGLLPSRSQEQAAASEPRIEAMTEFFVVTIESVEYASSASPAPTGSTTLCANVSTVKNERTSWLGARYVMMPRS